MMNAGHVLKKLLFLCSAVFILTWAISGCGRGRMDSDDMNEYLPDEIDGLKISGEPRTYDRDGIFRYIDGAGEVYRQYDYRRVLVKQYVGRENMAITAELFDMGTPSDAYGIFSHSRETPDIGFGQGSEFKSGLLCFWKNRYFVCLYSEEQSERTESAIRELASQIDSLTPAGGRVPQIVALLPAEGLDEFRVRFFHKYTSLSLHYYLADENILDLDETTNVVFAQYRPDAARILLIEYDDPGLADIAIGKFKTAYIPDADSSGMMLIENGKWVLARNIDRYAIVVLDSPDEQVAAALSDLIAANIRETAKEREASGE